MLALKSCKSNSFGSLRPGKRILNQMFHIKHDAYCIYIYTNVNSTAKPHQLSLAHTVSCTRHTAGGHPGTVHGWLEVTLLEGLFPGPDNTSGSQSADLTWKLIHISVLFYYLIFWPHASHEGTSRMPLISEPSKSKLSSGQLNDVLVRLDWE